MLLSTAAKGCGRWFMLVGLIACCFRVTWTLTDVKVIIPTAAVKGQRVTLRCQYDLETDQLYAVKWYKLGHEFYRYVQSDKPPIKQFPKKGLKVLENLSNSTHLVLDDVTLKTSGNYSCEVSADAPSFFTRMDSGNLQVIEVPRHDPQISGLKNRYRIGEVLKAHCVSKESNPAANLTWFVNGELVSPVHIRHARNSDKSYLKTANSGLTLHISKEMFSKGDRLKVRCVASMYDIYHRSAEKSLYLEKPTPRPSPPPDLHDSSAPIVLVGDWEFPSEKQEAKQERSPHHQESQPFSFWSFGFGGGSSRAATNGTAVVWLLFLGFFHLMR